MKLNAMIMRMLDWPCKKFEKFRDWLEEVGEKQLIEPTHEMITAGYRAADYSEVDVRAIFSAMIKTQDARDQLIKAGWCPPGGPCNPAPNATVSRPREGD